MSENAEKIVNSALTGQAADILGLVRLEMANLAKEIIVKQAETPIEITKPNKETK